MLYKRISFLIFISLAFQNAWALRYEVKRDPNPAKQIPGLKISETILIATEIFQEKSNSAPTKPQASPSPLVSEIEQKPEVPVQTLVKIKYEIKEKDGEMMSSNQVLNSLNKDQTAFSQTVDTKNAEMMWVTILWVSPLGDMTSEKILLQKIVDIVEGGVSRPWWKKFLWSAGTSISKTDYVQEEYEPLNQMLLTLKGGFNYPIILGKVDAGVTTFFSALPLTSSIPNTNLRFYGLNTRIGYRFEIKNYPEWKFGIHTGLYYTTSYSSQSDIGFTGMAGPQFFPTVSRKVTDKTFATGYYKFSPVGSGLWILDFDNREIAFGGGYGWFLNKGRSITATLDIATLSIRYEELVFKSKSYSLGFSFGF